MYMKRNWIVWFSIYLGLALLMFFSYFTYLPVESSQHPWDGSIQANAWEKVGTLSVFNQQVPVRWDRCQISHDSASTQINGKIFIAESEEFGITSSDLVLGRLPEKEGEVLVGPQTLAQLNGEWEAGQILSVVLNNGQTLEAKIVGILKNDIAFQYGIDDASILADEKFYSDLITDPVKKLIYFQAKEGFEDAIQDLQNVYTRMRLDGVAGDSSNRQMEPKFTWIRVFQLVPFGILLFSLLIIWRNSTRRQRVLMNRWGIESMTSCFFLPLVLGGSWVFGLIVFCVSFNWLPNYKQVNAWILCCLLVWLLGILAFLIVERVKKRGLKKESSVLAMAGRECSGIALFIGIGLLCLFPIIQVDSAYMYNDRESLRGSYVQFIDDSSDRRQQLLCNLETLFPEAEVLETKDSLLIASSDREMNSQIVEYLNYDSAMNSIVIDHGGSLPYIIEPLPEYGYWIGYPIVCGLVSGLFMVVWRKDTVEQKIKRRSVLEKWGFSKRKLIILDLCVIVIYGLATLAGYWIVKRCFLDGLALADYLHAQVVIWCYILSYFLIIGLQDLKVWRTGIILPKREKIK